MIANTASRGSLIDRDSSSVVHELISYTVNNEELF